MHSCTSFLLTLFCLCDLLNHTVCYGVLVLMKSLLCWPIWVMLGDVMGLVDLLCVYVARGGCSCLVLRLL